MKHLLTDKLHPNVAAEYHDHVIEGQLTALADVQRLPIVHRVQPVVVLYMSVYNKHGRIHFRYHSIAIGCAHF